ncbi:hypothetical protein RR11_1159 [Ruegeria sp. R11]|nr:hypothetical protein RR11_1159 [Ruegeria sp. R11]
MRCARPSDQTDPRIFPIWSCTGGDIGFDNSQITREAIFCVLSR